MANFNISYERTKKYEGGLVYAILKHDKGGETFAGISRVYNPSFTAWKYLDEQKKKYPGGRIPNNTKFPELADHVKNYYYKNYWIAKARGEEIKNQTVANLVFDMVVNHGKGAFIVNQALTNAGYRNTSSKINNDTLNILNSIPQKVYPYIWKAREKYIKGLSDFQHFGRGWMNRLNDFPMVLTNKQNPMNGGAVGGVALLVGLFSVFYFLNN